MRIIIRLILGLILLQTQAIAQDLSWEDRMRAGSKAYQRGDYKQAESHLRAGLDDAKKFGPNDPRLAANLNNLAELYRVQGHYAKAEPLYQRSLTILEKALGPEHPKVATSLENYAVLLRETERAAEAERMEARAKAIRAKTK